MATGTIHNCVLASQFENELAMVKAFGKTIHAIMTTQAIEPIGKRVRLHERRINLSMARCTSGGIEFRDVNRVAIATSKRFAIDVALVAV